MKVSILIPTYNRPEFLSECLESCVNQTYAPSEILIGDDSTNNLSELVAKGIDSSCRISYTRNKPSLGQADNVDSLIRSSSGDMLCLIHDDDKLELDALSKLLQAFAIDENTVVAFGKQRLISRNGEVHESASLSLNAQYFRNTEKSGAQNDIIKSAILQQIPNNGFLVRADSAKTISYSKVGRKYGDACDFGFALELALAFPEKGAYFVDEYTSFYRTSHKSISRSKSDNDAAYKAFSAQYSLAIEKYKYDLDVDQHLRNGAPIAISQAIQLGELIDAKRWLLSRYYREKLVSPRGLKRLFMLSSRSLLSRFWK